MSPNSSISMTKCHSRPCIRARCSTRPPICLPEDIVPPNSKNPATPHNKLPAVNSSRLQVAAPRRPVFFRLFSDHVLHVHIRTPDLRLPRIYSGLRTHRPLPEKVTSQSLEPSKAKEGSPHQTMKITPKKEYKQGRLCGGARWDSPTFLRVSIIANRWRCASVCATLPATSANKGVGLCRTMAHA
jgi:hypothetical protein